MERREAAEAPEASIVYDNVPLKTEEIHRRGSGSSSKGSSGRWFEATKGNSVGYKENLEELKKVVKLLEAERSQISQRQEDLVDQHAKIDFSLQLILDEIAALKTRTSQDNDLNVLMVQFIVVAVRLLVEAAFNKDKVEELLPSLEAELQRLNLPTRHPRLLACFNRLREVSGKPPMSVKDLVPVSVVISSAPSDSLSKEGSLAERRRSPRSPAGVLLSGELLPGSSELGEKQRGGGSEQQTATAATAGAPPPTPATGGKEEGTAQPSQTSLVDVSDDDEKRSPGSVSVERSPSAASGEHLTDSSPRGRLSKLSASAEFYPRRESLFTPKERRRTATAFGDGDLPLFQQFAVAGAAPAPDEFSGLRTPLDTATLSKSNSKLGVVCDSLHEEGRRQPEQRQQADRMNIAGRFSGSNSFGGGENVGGQREVYGHSSHQTSGLLLRDRQRRRSAAEAESMGSTEASESIEGMLKHASTILSMSPSELRAALLQSASGAKLNSGLQELDRQTQTSKQAMMNSSDRLDSEGPPAPMSSLADAANRDQLQLLQEAVAAVARAVTGEFPQDGRKSGELLKGNAAAGLSNKEAQLQPNKGAPKEKGAESSSTPVLLECAVHSESFKGGLSPQSFEYAAAELPYGALQGHQTPEAAGNLAPVVGSPFAGRIAPPSTPDGLTHPAGDPASRLAYTGGGGPAASEAQPHMAKAYLPADQKAWQQFFSNTALSQQQRKEHELLEGRTASQGKGLGEEGVIGSVYVGPLVDVQGATPLQGPPPPPFIVDSAVKPGGLAHGCLKGTVPSSLASRRQRLMDMYRAPVVTHLPAVKIANPTARSSAAHEVKSGCLGCGCGRGWCCKKPPVEPHSATIMEESTHETPRVEGGWACSRTLPCCGSKSPQNARSSSNR